MIRNQLSAIGKSMPAYFGSNARLFSDLSAQIQSGDFWADRRFGGDYAGRLKNAMENLPLPAAFRDSLIAVRGIIKAHIKAGNPYANELVLLYWLAALESFSMPHSEKLQSPGFNILISIPWNVITSLEFEYSTLGYQDLSLKKTDIKWLTTAFGEPISHSSLIVMYRHIWDTHEEALVTKRALELQELRRDLGL